MRRKIYIITVLLVQTACTFGQEKSVIDSIRIYFEEIRANTNHYKDLWNLDLYGPILLVNSQTRQIYANYPDAAAVLNRVGSE